jgi:hypothetical protein
MIQIVAALPVIAVPTPDISWRRHKHLFDNPVCFFCLPAILARKISSRAAV